MKIQKKKKKLNNQLNYFNKNFIFFFIEKNKIQLEK